MYCRYGQKHTSQILADVMYAQKIVLFYCIRMNTHKLLSTPIIFILIWCKRRGHHDIALILSLAEYCDINKYIETTEYANF